MTELEQLIEKSKIRTASNTLHAISRINREFADRLAQKGERESFHTLEAELSQAVRYAEETGETAGLIKLCNQAVDAMEKFGEVALIRRLWADSKVMLTVLNQSPIDPEYIAEMQKAFPGIYNNNGSIDLFAVAAKAQPLRRVSMTLIEIATNGLLVGGTKAFAVCKGVLKDTGHYNALHDLHSQLYSLWLATPAPDEEQLKEMDELNKKILPILKELDHVPVIRKFLAQFRTELTEAAAKLGVTPDPTLTIEEAFQQEVDKQAVEELINSPAFKATRTSVDAFIADSLTDRQEAKTKHFFQAYTLHGALKNIEHRSQDLLGVAGPYRQFLPSVFTPEGKVIMGQVVNLSMAGQGNARSMFAEYVIRYCGELNIIVGMVPQGELVDALRIGAQRVQGCYDRIARKVRHETREDFDAAYEAFQAAEYLFGGLHAYHPDIDLRHDYSSNHVIKPTNEVDKFFYETYDRILNEGVLKADRTGVGTKAVVGVLGRFDISLGRAVLPTTKELLTFSSFNEMIHLFVAGTSSIKALRDRKIGIWDDWFIAGTDSYDEPSEPYLLEYRAQLAREAGLEQELYEWLDCFKVDQGLVHEQNENQNYAEVNLELCPSHTGPWDLYPSEVAQLQEWLTMKGIPVFRKPGGQRVSLQKRLSRVSKNDTVKWDRINAVIDEDWNKLNESSTGVQILKAGEDVKVTIFKEGVFKEVVIRPIVAQAIVAVLDHFNVPAYPLLDADIGEGSYGVQWRRWQDTQLCGDSVEEFQAYMDAGYELVGSFPNPGNGIQVNVMHREIDQLQNAIDMLKNDPDSRRIIVNAWNPGRIWQAALPPCHLYFQFISHEMTLQEREEWREHYVEREVDYLNTLFAESGNSFPVAIKGEDYPAKSEGLDGFAKHELLTAAQVPTRKLSCFVLLRSSLSALAA